MRRMLLTTAALVTAATTAFAEPYVSGFVEALHVLRVQNNRALGDGPSFQDRTYPRSELRSQLAISGGGDREEYFVRLDFLSDQAVAGSAALDVREAYVKFYPYDWLDLKVGRQIATWGTGDLLFANDLFAKDWVAFFTGQELSYLKPPQDLLRAAIYTGGPTIEIAASPYYTMDHLPTGERLSIYNPWTRRTVNSEDAPPVQERVKNLRNAEVFARVSGFSGGYEWALYGYRGFFPQPLGVTVAAGDTLLFAPSLASAGASLRGSIGSYLINLETALYYSEDDAEGDDPMLPNSSVKLLAGAEKSLGHELTVGAQWFGDWLLDYDAYARPFTAMDIAAPADELRHTVALRLTKFLRYQTVKLTFFGYWGISDEDVYLRPSAEYDFSDALNLSFGFNWLDGEAPYTMFGQFRDNSNVYGRVRYSF